MKSKMLATLLISITFLTLMSLGFWQVYRLKVKNELIAHINKEIIEDAKTFDIKNVIITPYKKYKLSGKFIKNKDIFLYGSNFAMPPKAGYFIFTPFITNDGQFILVNRGWNIDKNLNESIFNESNIEITTLLMLPPKENMFLPKNELAKNIWMSINLEEIKNFLNIPIEQKFYMNMISGPSDFLLPKPEEFIKIRNTHLSYAITWFSLGIIFLIIVYFKRKEGDL